jgi:hypothetical protein
MPSQRNQDKILQQLLQKVKNSHSLTIEFGYIDESSSNTSWSKNRLLFDIARENKEINLFKYCITSENICKIFENHNVPVNPLYVSIDIDSTDYWVADAILSKYKPSILSVEYNANIGLQYSVSLKNDPTLRWQKDRVFGCSLMAVKFLADKYNYKIVAIEKFLDVFLVPKDNEIKELVNLKDYIAYKKCHARCKTNRVHDFINLATNKQPNSVFWQHFNA